MDKKKVNPSEYEKASDNPKMQKSTKKIDGYDKPRNGFTVGSYFYFTDDKGEMYKVKSAEVKAKVEAKEDSSKLNFEKGDEVEVEYKSHWVKGKVLLAYQQKFSSFGRKDGKDAYSEPRWSVDTTFTDAEGKKKTYGNLTVEPGRIRVAKSKKTKAESLVERIQTQNKEYGFFGTFKTNNEVGDSEAEKAYAAAHTQAKKYLSLNDEEAREFLDSRHGRHYADQVDKDGSGTEEYLKKHGASIKKDWTKNKGALMTSRKK